jgi:non-ribosomal peptide synthase protein (TIGR01720 family)
VAYVVLTDPSRAKNAANKLRSHLRRRLPEFMVPARMEIVRALPLSRNGKIDLAALQSGVSRLPEVRAESCVAARNETERVLGVVWCRTLGLARVGIDENFFELGGDSLQSVQMITAAGGIGLNLRISDLHECPTIRQLALRVRRVGPRPESLTLNHDIPLTPTQRWFFDRPLRYPERYNAVFAFDVLNGVSVDHLRIAWKQVVQHHDALRMRFCRANGVWRQFAALNDANDLTVWDLSDLSERAQLAEVERRVTGVRVGFDLDHGPSARAFILIRGGGKPARLMLVLHHLVFDAISLGVLAQDMTWAIEQLQQQKPVRLPECGSFAEWAIGLSKLAESASVQAERAYWLGLPWGQVTPLPRDVWDGENKYGSIGTMRAQLSKAETCALLRELPSCCRASVGEILLAACLRVLSRWAKTRTLLVDLTVHGRHDAFGEGSASRMMGYLTCNIPVVVTVSPESSLAQLACGVRDHLRRMPSQGMGFGMLRYLSPDDEVAARLRECPQAEVKFNYLGSLVAAGAMTGLFRPAKTTDVGVLDPRDERAYLHNLELAIVDESLEIEWKYSGAIHRAKTIESLLGQLMSAVRQMIGEATSAKELVDRDVCGGGLR